ncbi:MAG: L-threonylcarbamoyladenylate synthase [SAR86 cluster bacterium]|jgi:tRNA threonylcarbamoyl adenosine modification protein (Sua5/YciO/YrdC/YwlC family)|tara:strand:- start:13916 stop:14539 length:624 start_codon:yes stop_codon:yes gene_type:complete
MSQFFQIHPDNPQARLIRQAVDIIRQGGVIIYPTDSAYALGCHIGDKQALQRIRQIRRLDDDHNFSLVCRDLSDLGIYAKVSNSAYRLLRAATPGPYTFVLQATKEVPRRLVDPKRKTIGLRVPNNAICSALLSELGEPIMSSSLILPGQEDPLTDPLEMRDLLEKQVDLIIDGGFCGLQSTSVINLEDDQVEILREGCGDLTLFGG